MKKSKNPETDPLRQGRSEFFNQLHTIDEAVSDQLEAGGGIVPQEALKSRKTVERYLKSIVQFGIVFNPHGKDGFYRFDYLTGSIFVNQETGEIEGLAIPETAGVTALGAIVLRKANLLE